MEEKEKKELFERGAKAAIKQLEKFEWNYYFELRTNKDGYGKTE